MKRFVLDLSRGLIRLYGQKETVVQRVMPPTVSFYLQMRKTANTSIKKALIAISG